MTRLQFDAELLKRATLNNAEAMDFLANHWSPYVHAIDDIIDGEMTDARDILKTFARAPMLFSHPFYIKNLPALRQLVLSITVLYADSADWERTGTAWQKEWADHNRHAAMEMVVAVAMICGGPDHGFAISREQRVLCYLDHHDRKGNIT